MTCTHNRTCFHSTAAGHSGGTATPNHPCPAGLYLGGLTVLPGAHTIPARSRGVGCAEEKLGLGGRLWGGSLDNWWVLWTTHGWVPARSAHHYGQCNEDRMCVYYVDSEDMIDYGETLGGRTREGRRRQDERTPASLSVRCCAPLARRLMPHLLYEDNSVKEQHVTANTTEDPPCIPDPHRQHPEINVLFVSGPLHHRNHSHSVPPCRTSKQYFSPRFQTQRENMLSSSKLKKKNTQHNSRVFAQADICFHIYIVFEFPRGAP